MPEQTQAAAPDLEARLSEIDARLVQIQTGLAPDREPRPGAAPTASAPPPEPEPPPELRPPPEPPPPAPVLEEPPPRPEADRTAGDPHAKLLSSMRELLAAYELVLAQLREPQSPAATSAVDLVTVAAGPFETTDAVRAFEQALAALPHVREVTLRGYEGEDRALFDVHLGGGTA